MKGDFKMKWKISIGSSLLIWAIAIGLIVYWHGEIPSQLTNTSAFSTTKSESSAEQSKELKDIIHEVQKVVVMIELEDGSLGSGFLYNNKGDVITNAHVVNGAKKVKIKTADAQEFEGTVIGLSKDIDVAAVRVPGLVKEQPLDISKKKAELGDEILALGSPLGLQNTVTTGIISGVGRSFEIPPYQYTDAYQISAPIAPGNSGGPLINSNTGQVLGINSAGTDQGSIGFSIPIVNVMSLVKGWSESPMTDIPTLSTQGLENEDNNQLSLEETASYLVNYFYESINSGDYVTAYAILGSSWQNKTDFTTFRNGYLQTTSVSVDDLQPSKAGDKVSVICIISAEEQEDEGTVYSKYKLEYTVGYENDQMRILSGSAKRID